MGCFTVFCVTTKEAKIKPNIMMNDYPEGGLKRIDVDSLD